MTELSLAPILDPIQRKLRLNAEIDLVTCFDPGAARNLAALLKMLGILFDDEGLSVATLERVHKIMREETSAQ